MDNNAIKDVRSMTLMELKSEAYDQMLELERIQANLNILDAAIKRKIDELQTPPKENNPKGQKSI